jgi:hypothetical protein
LVMRHSQDQVWTDLVGNGKKYGHVVRLKAVIHSFW